MTEPVGEYEPVCSDQWWNHADIGEIARGKRQGGFGFLESGQRVCRHRLIKHGSADKAGRARAHAVGLRGADRRLYQCRMSGET